MRIKLEWLRHGQMGLPKCKCHSCAALADKTAWLNTQVVSCSYLPGWDTGLPRRGDRRASLWFSVPASSPEPELKAGNCCRFSKAIQTSGSRQKKAKCSTSADKPIHMGKNTLPSMQQLGPVYTLQIHCFSFRHMRQVSQQSTPKSFY